MSSSALIIFVRNPVLGKVKTRLGESLGAESALKIYQKLLAHTQNVTKHLPVDKYIFYADYTNQDDLWENERYHKELQNGADLGERMKNAFETLFSRGYREVVIIGSDCYELTPGIIQTAFDTLADKDVVIGPASDGGYYLLGMNRMIHQLFENKNWSGPDVFSQTVNQVLELGHSFRQLCQLNDVDEEKDVPFSY